DLQVFAAAVGKVGGEHTGLIRQRDLVEYVARQFADPPRYGAATTSECLPRCMAEGGERAGRDVIEHGHVGQYAQVLEGAADAQAGNPVRLHSRQRAPGEADLALARRDEAGDEVEESR